MHKIFKNEEATELKNKDVITNIFKRLYDKNIKLDDLKTGKKCRSVLIIQPKILYRDLNTVLFRDQYFGGVARERQRPFIDSMFTVYREHLPSNAFEILIHSSRWLGSFKITSEGLTQFVVVTPTELKKARAAKKPGYAVETDYFSKIQNAKFGNSTNSTPGNKNMVTKNKKIHVVNTQNIKFSGEPATN